eukprot:TRINITY_DN67996_c5_g1_i2.p1 TRINITY_DN67996_c5_g1~~TRINITY_DN67996_c5_g1_i2.p1  ORF type:complete len:447 (+),score=42.43 TRINITY_DN67996_c5_g1_i2:41-1342(+)
MRDPPVLSVDDIDVTSREFSNRIRYKTAQSTHHLIDRHDRAKFDVFVTSKFKTTPAVEWSKGHERVTTLSATAPLEVNTKADYNPVRITKHTPGVSMDTNKNPRFDGAVDTGCGLDYNPNVDFVKKKLSGGAVDMSKATGRSATPFGQASPFFSKPTPKDKPSDRSTVDDSLRASTAPEESKLSVSQKKRIRELEAARAKTPSRLDMSKMSGRDAGMFATVSHLSINKDPIDPTKAKASLEPRVKGGAWSKAPRKTYGWLPTDKTPPTTYDKKYSLLEKHTKGAVWFAKQQDRESAYRYIEKRRNLTKDCDYRVRDTLQRKAVGGVYGGQAQPKTTGELLVASEAHRKRAVYMLETAQRKPKNAGNSTKSKAGRFKSLMGSSMFMSGSQPSSPGSSAAASPVSQPRGSPMANTTSVSTLLPSKSYTTTTFDSL